MVAPALIIKTNINSVKVTIPMKKLSIFLAFFMIVSVISSAKTIEEELRDDESINVPGYNITLLTVGANKKSLVVCINNERYILNKESRKEIENLKIEPARIYEDYARFKITYSCESCKCDESCSNALCFSREKEESIDEIIEEDDGGKNNVEKRENIKSVSMLLFLIVLILLALLVTKRKRGR